MGLAPGPSQRTLLQTTIRTAKAARFSYRALPGSLAVTRGILRVFPPDLGSQSEQGLRSAGGCPAGVPLEPGPRTATSSHAWPGEGGATTRRAVPLGQSVFQPTSPGAGRQSAPRRPTAPPVVGQERMGCTLDLVASGATCVQRLDGSRDTAIHTKYRISLRSSSMREPRYPLPRVVLGYRVRGRTPWGAADAEPVGAGHKREARGFDGRFAPGRAPVAAGYRVQLVRLGRARFVESTMILPQWTSRNVIGGEPPTSPPIQHFTGPFNR
ncbi:hypothetical protein H6P81_016037 [Aristolochia fimbriata]|uniref:Uncharacterized protein n=1 Tax=Aristolochia fimbriata TaxID=158543 RepID=A0AAV7E780_ARIFI|nr:hypothetical protein H6P81_016037 [Aristolochia fimbriata]